ncbi:MAG: LysM peptidoglycan-binding domain-containing protein [Gammaproteobacteria bacterium]|nr:LysM peptidoglycan-binding domain-containing protein [Gammaproteobacteria bacterium]
MMTAVKAMFRSILVTLTSLVVVATLASCSLLKKNDREVVIEEIETEETVSEEAVVDYAAVDEAAIQRAAQDISCDPGFVDELAADHPDQYIVVRGDTLWDISSKFLRNAWLWPEIWHINQYIENPHLIFPGDELNLRYFNGCPQITLTRGPIVYGDGEGLQGRDKLSPRIRSYPLDQAISTIPYDAIASFISKPALLERSQIRRAPYVVSIRGDHLIAGVGYDTYVRNAKKAVEGARFNVYHIGDTLRDPERGRALGYEALYVGAGHISRTGDPATLRITESTRETLRGDRLLVEEGDIPLNFYPRAPDDTEIKATILAVIDGISLVGQYQVVAINRGNRHGLEPGHVLKVWQSGKAVTDPYAGGRSIRPTGKTKLAGIARLPEERAGEMMVFRSYDRMSFALILDSTNEIRVGDVGRSPRYSPDK